jgi:hypothetical protein
MIQPAIADYLGTVLLTWYRYAADWSPPGRMSAEVCLLCLESPFARLFDVERWPHDVVHQLVTSLATAADEICASIAEDQRADLEPGSESELEERMRLRAISREVEHMVIRSIAAQAGDILDVMRECVTPRVDRYVEHELERAMFELGRSGDRTGT